MINLSHCAPDSFFRSLQFCSSNNTICSELDSAFILHSSSAHVLSRIVTEIESEIKILPFCFYILIGQLVISDEGKSPILFTLMTPIAPRRKQVRFYLIG